MEIARGAVECDLDIQALMEEVGANIKEANARVLGEGFVRLLYTADQKKAPGTHAFSYVSFLAEGVRPTDMVGLGEGELFASLVWIPSSFQRFEQRAGL